VDTNSIVNVAYNGDTSNTDGAVKISIGSTTRNYTCSSINMNSKFSPSGIEHVSVKIGNCVTNTFSKDLYDGVSDV
jgi:hypothetical protein